MKLKQYNAARLVIAMLLAAFIASSVVRRDFFWPVVAMAVAILFLFLLRSRVKEVMADERDMALGGAAAMLAIKIFSLFSVVSMFIMFAYQDLNPGLKLAASVLAYATCALMLLYTLIFSVLRRRSPLHA
jgi:uncharacterized membrane protein